MTLLEVSGLRSGYGPMEVIHDIGLVVAEGSTVVVLGANGAGKTTLLRALSGLLPAQGSIRLGGRELARRSPRAFVGAGVAHVPQGRGTFTDLTVGENLRLGAYRRRDAAAIRGDERQLLELFPVLRDRRRQPAGRLSGGEQQMLAVARALMARPRLLLLDEPSLGLAPKVTAELFAVLAQLSTTILLVEQNARLALRLAQHVVILKSGRIVLSEPAAAIDADDRIRRAYLGH